MKPKSSTSPTRTLLAVPVSRALFNQALGVAESLRQQIEQMKDMFPGDEDIKDALTDHDALIAACTKANKETLSSVLRDIAAPSSPREIWTVVYDTDAGLGAYAFETEDSALNHVLEYVKENWGTTLNLPPLPDDRKEAIEMYFNRDGCDERADVKPIMVQS